MGRRRKKVRDGESKGGNRGHFSRRKKAKGMRSPHDTGRSFLPSPTSGPAVFRRRGVVRPLRYSVRVYSSRKSRQKMSGGRASPSSVLLVLPRAPSWVTKEG